MPTTVAGALRQGDIVAIRQRLYQVRAVATPHPAGVRLAFHGWGHVTLRRNTELIVVGNKPPTTRQTPTSAAVSPVRRGLIEG